MIRRQPSRKRFAAPLVVALSLALSSCSSGSSGVHLQSVDPPSSPSVSVAQSAPQSTQSSVLSVAPQSTRPAVSSSPATKPSTSATKRPTSSVATVSSTTNPWPANFSPAQQADARAALAAFDGYLTASAAANANPAVKDWTKTIRKYAADPTAAQTLDGVASLKTAKVRELVSASVSGIKVKSADAKRIVVQACSDGSDIKLVDLAGKPVKFQQQKNPRTILTYSIFQYGAKYGGWLVRETLVPNPPQKC